MEVGAQPRHPDSCRCSPASPTAAAPRPAPSCRRRWRWRRAPPRSWCATGRSTSARACASATSGRSVTAMPPWLSWYAPYGLLTPAVVGGAPRPPLHARLRRHQRGLRSHRGGRPQARGDEPRRLVLRAADHARGPSGVALDRRAGPAAARLLPGERRRRRAGGHLGRARPRPAPAARARSPPPRRARPSTAR